LQQTNKPHENLVVYIVIAENTAGILKREKQDQSGIPGNMWAIRKLENPVEFAIFEKP
jgi:hypothetical protein